MTTLIWLAGSSILWGGVLCLAALALQKTGDLSGRARRWLWSAVAGLLVAPWIAAPVVGMLGLGMGASTAATTSAALASLPASGEAAGGIGMLEATTVQPVVSSNFRLPDLSWGELAIIVLMAGWIIRFVLAQYSARTLMGIVAISERVETSSATRSLSSWARRLGLKRRPDLRVVPASVSPFSYGVLKPVVCLPEGLDGKLSSEALDLVVGHECLHVASGDGWRRPIERVVADIFWFNPFAWVVRRQLDTARELACDEGVITLSDAPRAYARTLRDVAGLASGLPLSAPAASMSIAGGGRALVERVSRTLTHACRKPARATFAIAGLLCAIAVPAALAQSVLATPRVPPPPAAPQAPPMPMVADHLDFVAPPAPPAALAVVSPPAPPAPVAQPSPPLPKAQPAPPSPPPFSWSSLDGAPVTQPTPPTPPVAAVPVTPVTPRTLVTPLTPMAPLPPIAAAPVQPAPAPAPTPAPLAVPAPDPVAAPSPLPNLPAPRAPVQYVTPANLRIDGAAPVLEGPRARMTSSFGYRADPFNPEARQLHAAVDLAQELGAAVHAPAAGRVTFAGDMGADGRVIEVAMKDGYAIRFGHIAEMKVAVGDRVAAGSVIGTMGGAVLDATTPTAQTTGPHLHLEVLKDGRPVDPQKVQGLVLIGAN